MSTQEEKNPLTTVVHLKKKPWSTYIVLNEPRRSLASSCNEQFSNPTR